MIFKDKELKEGLKLKYKGRTGVMGFYNYSWCILDLEGRPMEYLGQVSLEKFEWEGEENAETKTLQGM